MDIKKLLDQIAKYISNQKNLYNLVIVFLVGVLLVIVTNFFNSTNFLGAAPANASADTSQVSQPTVSEILNYEQSKKSELKSYLTTIKGVGRVEVMMHFGSGEELVPAVNSTSGNNTVDEKDPEGGVRKTTQVTSGSNIVMHSKGSNTEALILKKIYPKITGVAIAAEGADDSKVRAQIMSIVTKVFDLPSNKVEVSSMKN